MTSALLRIVKPAVEACQAVPTPSLGLELGWDHARYGLLPPLDHLDPASLVRQGWEAGRSTFGARTLQPNRFVQQWLDLRLKAGAAGHAFDHARANPTFLRQIDVAVCPITRERLTTGVGLPTDACVERVAGEAYGAGTLAVMSVRGGAALAQCLVDRGPSQQTATALAQTAIAHDAAEGLDAAQAARVAVLASFAQPLPHRRAAAIPLRVLPPNRLLVVNPVQSLQILLTLQVVSAGHGRRSALLADLLPSQDARLAFFPFMLTLVARRVAAGPAPDAVAERHLLEDLWSDPRLLRRWERFTDRLTRDDCDRIVRTATERGLAGSGIQWSASESNADDATSGPGWSARQHRRHSGRTGSGRIRARPHAVDVAPAAAPSNILGRQARLI